MFENQIDRGGERQPTPTADLRRVPLKNDKQKTAKVVTPLRLQEKSIPFDRNMVSTLRVEWGHTGTRIFLTGYPYSCMAVCR